MFSVLGCCGVGDAGVDVCPFVKRVGGPLVNHFQTTSCVKSLTGCLERRT